MITGRLPGGPGPAPVIMDRARQMEPFFAGLDGLWPDEGFRRITEIFHVGRARDGDD